MPSIHLFERRTLFGGDDLQFGALVTAVLRCVQLTLLLGPVLAHIAHESRDNGGFLSFLFYDPDLESNEECRNSHIFSILLVSYAAASCLYGFASLLLEWRIARCSCIGTPTDNRVRTPKISYLLEIKLAPFSLLLFSIWLSGVSSLFFAPVYYRCRDAEDASSWVLQQQKQREQQTLLSGDDALQEEPDESSFFSGIKLWWLAIFFLLLSQASEILVAWLFILHLCFKPRDSRVMGPFSPEARSVLLENEYLNHELMEQMWADRCAAACQCLGVASCFAFGGRELLGNAEFGDVARALADYLETGGVLDIVPSDIVMGFMILQRLQLERSLEARRQLWVDVELSGEFSSQPPEDENDVLAPATRDDLFLPLGPSTSIANTSNLAQLDGTYGSSDFSTRSVLLQSSTEGMTDLGEGARYADFALAIYTWVLYLYVHPLTGVCRLASTAGFSCCRSVVDGLFSHERDSVLDSGRVDGDNICQSHKAALLLTVGLEKADLVYAQLRSSFTQNPYCILVDHEWKSVVVAIRGTFSLEDCVTDVLIEPEPLELLGEEFGFDGRNQFCHRGVMVCARNIHRDLERLGILDSLLRGEHARYPTYTLKFVGHSLGASACTLLSYMMRSKFPTLKCISYSPPGWSFTWDMAVGCHDWCTTYVLDSDIVPRLSQHSLEVLRDEVLELIGRVKVPKIEVVNRFVRGIGAADDTYLCFDPPINAAAEMDTIGEILYSPHEVPDSEYTRQLERFKRIQEERRLSRGTTRSVKMYPAGKIIHLVKTGEKASCCHGLAKCLTCFSTNAGFVYTPLRVANDSLNEIVVNPHMGTDHFPNRMSSVIRSVAASYGLGC